MSPTEAKVTGGGGERPSSPPDSRAPIAISVRGVSKAFGAVQALGDVDCDIRGGEVHGLIGANGAGKSTLIKVLAGAVIPDEGTITVDGEEVTISDPRDSTELGFQFLHQELNLVPKFDALENMSLGLIGRNAAGLIDKGPTYRRARGVAEEIGLDFPLDRPVADLSVAQRWLVALGRSLMRRARLIAFDEPTASLSDKEAEKLFQIIRRMTADGIAVLYVSHRLEEVEALCDRATAFREGRVVADLDAAKINRTSLIEAITGGEAEAVSVAPAEEGVEPGAVIMEARDLVSRPAVRGVSIQLRANEVVGMAGLVGAGRTECARLLFGADRADSGEILVDGKPVKMSSPAVANRLGIGLVPEERRSQSLFLDRDATFNVNIAAGTSLRSKVAGLISMRRARSQAKQTAERVDLRPPNVDTQVRLLSGGNQQKLAVGRWLLGRRRVLILDEPTRGVDIGARAGIHRMLRDLADEGMSLLVISSDFDELLSCDRVLVMHEGRIAEELRGKNITVDRMLRAAYGEGGTTNTNQENPTR
jgi:ribose transport system ATP-binding protein